MKTVEFALPDEEADALEQAALAYGFASPAELVRTAIEHFLPGPPEFGPEEFEDDIAEHEAAKARGEPALTAEEARLRLREAAERR
jgi:hypothetical protein